MAMNKTFKELSLLAGGSHYPTINPDLQQKFGESVVLKILERIEHEIEQAYKYEQTYAIASLEALAIEILDEFEMEITDENN